MEHLFQELLQHYFHGTVHSIETVPFGMTNDSRIVAMRLTRAEIQWIPYIMQLYYVSLLSIYIGQHLAGRNIASYFHLMLKQLRIRREWMERKQHEFVELLYSKCL